MENKPSIYSANDRAKHNHMMVAAALLSVGEFCESTGCPYPDPIPGYDISKLF